MAVSVSYVSLWIELFVHIEIPSTTWTSRRVDVLLKNIIQNIIFKLFVARADALAHDETEQCVCRKWQSECGKSFAKHTLGIERDCQLSINRMNNLTILIFIWCRFLLLLIYLLRFCHIRLLPQPNVVAVVVVIVNASQSNVNVFICSMIYVYQNRCWQIIIRRIRSFSFLVCPLCCTESKSVLYGRVTYITCTNTIHAEWYRKPIIIIVLFEHNHEHWAQREKWSDAETIMFYSFAFLRNRESVYSMVFLATISFVSFARARHTPLNKQKAIFFSSSILFCFSLSLSLYAYSFFVRLTAAAVAVRVEFYCYCCY